MSEPYVGEVRCVGFNFAPKNWAECDGNLLAIAQNTALFSLLGTQYGGDGRVTFALPDLQGRVAISQGSGGGLTPRNVGDEGGEQTVTLLQATMPSHNHRYMTNVADGPADQTLPSPTASISSGPAMFTNATTPVVQMASNMLPVTGGSQPHNNMMQYLTLNFVIALAGIFPQRS